MSLRQQGVALPLEREPLIARVAGPQQRLLVLVHRVPVLSAPILAVAAQATGEI
jgi:hypothetical protein